MQIYKERDEQEGIIEDLIRLLSFTPSQQQSYNYYAMSIAEKVVEMDGKLIIMQQDKERLE